MEIYRQCSVNGAPGLSVSPLPTISARDRPRKIAGVDLHRGANLEKLIGHPLLLRAATPDQLRDAESGCAHA